MLVCVFAKTGIPGSMVPALFAAKDEWAKLKKTAPERVKRPARCVLLSCLMKEIHDRLKAVQQDEARRASMEKLGWLKADKFQGLIWSPTAKKLVVNPDGVSVSYEEVLEILSCIMQRTNTVEAVMRFHPTRPLSDNMPVGALAFLLQFNLWSEDGMKLYKSVSQLCGSGSTMVAGIEVRKERVGRSALANQLSQS